MMYGSIGSTLPLLVMYELKVCRTGLIVETFVGSSRLRLPATTITVTARMPKTSKIRTVREAFNVTTKPILARGMPSSLTREVIGTIQQNKFQPGVLPARQPELERLEHMASICFRRSMIAIV